MTAAHTLDRSAEAPAEPMRVPANIEAEHALLGILLCDNGAFERLDDGLRASHFYEPLHQRLFASIETAIRKGQLASTQLIGPIFEGDEAYDELGGWQYLADLIDRAPPPSQARDFGRAVHDMATRREILRIADDASMAVRSDLETPAREHAEAVEQQLFSLAEAKGGSGVVSFSDALAGAMQMAAEAFSRDGGLSGLSTGLIDLDQKLGGLHPSDLVILAARPSMGKTSLAANIAYEAARNYRYEQQPDGTKKTTSGGVVLFFSLEMSAEQLALRLVSAAAGVSGDRLRKGEIDTSDFHRVRDAAMEIDDIPLFIDATGGLQMSKLAARARRQKRLTGVDLIVVDYLQLITLGGKTENRVQEVSTITQSLKALAKDLNVPVLALSQLSRQVEQREDKKPQLSDLRESGSIEQDADMVIFLYREEYYLSRGEPKPDSHDYEKWRTEMDACRGTAEAIIGKQRHGPIGTVRLSFQEDLTKFGNLARDSHQGMARYPYGDA